MALVPIFNAHVNEKATGLEFVSGENTLTLRDAQHEYVFTAQASSATAAP